MRILMISHLVDFGGVGIYVHNLSKELSKQGVDVGYLYAGEYNFLIRPYVRWRLSNGITYLSFVNSPNTYPSFAYTHPRDQKSVPIIEHNFIKLIDKFKPDIIHIHDIAGFCSSLIEIAHNQNIPIVNSLHNYWYICPRVELFDNVKMTICSGPKDGLNCSQYVPFNPGRLGKAKAKLRVQGIKNLFRTVIGDSRVGQLRILRKKFQGNRIRKTESKQHNKSVVIPSLVSDYVEREKYHRYLLSEKVDINIAVSNFVKSRFEDFGIPSSKILVQHIGTKAAEFLKPTNRTNKNVTFGYIGPLTPHKGANVLIQAFSGLQNRKARLIVYGYNPRNEYAQNLKMLSRGKLVDFRPGYKYQNLQQVLSEIDIVVVPPIWYDNAPQVVFEALATKTPVIGSNIGGIPDFIKDGVNGFLFEAGNVEELRNKMLTILTNPDIIDEFKSQIIPMKTMKSHTEEMIALYRGLL